MLVDYVDVASAGGAIEANKAGVTAVPTTQLVTAAGKVLARFEGARHLTACIAAIDAELGIHDVDSTIRCLALKAMR